MSPGQFLDAVFPHIMDAGASTTSWVRNPNRNAVVGGSNISYHLCGLAIDVVEFRDNDARALFIDRMHKLGFGVLDEGDHIHVQRFRKAAT